MHTPRLPASVTLALALLFSTTACCKKDCAPAASAPASSAAPAASANVAAIQLFNGKDLAGWTPCAKDNSPDAAGTWGVKDGVITSTGKPFGYLRTDKRYSNYRLTVEWRWLEGTHGSDANGNIRPRNSGVFLHMQGKDEVWPVCIEAQLAEGNAGDFIITGISANELNAARAAAIAAAGDNEAARKKAANKRGLPKKNPSSEKPAGEWNRYDIVCDGDTITVNVNGVEQNRLTGVTVREGHICLQAEGAPVEFRNITLAPLR